MTKVERMYLTDPILTTNRKFVNPLWARFRQFYVGSPYSGTPARHMIKLSWLLLSRNRDSKS